MTTNGRQMSPDERDEIIKRLRPEFKDYYDRPYAYDFEMFHASWTQKLHTMACTLAAFRQTPKYSESHYNAAVGTAISHWSSFGDWRPSRDLRPFEWIDLIAIANALGVRGMQARYDHRCEKEKS